MLDKQGQAQAFERTSNSPYLNPVNRFYCPFCLRRGSLPEFWRRLANGKVRKTAVCPECKLKMHTSSLTAFMTIDVYAKWIVNYPYSLFWERCDFEVWVKRLLELDPNRKFWTHYHDEKSKALGVQR